MDQWSIAYTANNDEEQILDFVAQAVLAGASQIVLFVEDPAHPSLEKIGSIPSVHIQICDESYWNNFDEKPKSQKARNEANACFAYSHLLKTKWLIPLSGRDFLSTDGNIGKSLSLSKENLLCLPPYERFQSEGRNDKPSMLFRRALPDDELGKEIGHKAYGERYALSNRGLLGSLTNACFIRAGQKLSSKDFQKILTGDHKAPICESIYFMRTPFPNFEEWKNTAQAQDIEASENFYNEINVFSRSKRPLKRQGFCRFARDWSAQMRAELFGESPPFFHNLSLNPDSGNIEGDVNWEGIKMHLSPEGNHTELRLSRGRPAEAQEHKLVKDIVEGKKVRFYDVGGNAGVYSLRVAYFSDPASKITTYEPNPVMVARLEKNIALNDFSNIEIKKVAIAGEEGVVHFSVNNSNLGNSRVVEDDTGMEVRSIRLLDELEDPSNYDLSLLKVDVEGFEPAVFSSLFSVSKDKLHWPNYILMEQAHSEDWRDELFLNLRNAGYEIYYENPSNIIWHHNPKNNEN